MALGTKWQLEMVTLLSLAECRMGGVDLSGERLDPSKGLEGRGKDDAAAAIDEACARICKHARRTSRKRESSKSIWELMGASWATMYPPSEQLTLCR